MFFIIYWARNSDDRFLNEAHLMQKKVLSKDWAAAHENLV